MVDLILLEDEPTLREEIAEFLESRGYEATCAASMAEFEQLFDPGRHRVAIIDIGLPDGNGLQLIERLRATGLSLGIIVFSARGTSSDKIAGLDVGADHYLGKGCDLDELASTLSALAKRLDLRPRERWRLELGARRLHAPSAPPVALSSQEAAMLHCLMRQAGTVVGYQEISRALGAPARDDEQQRLDAQMSRLRRKIQDDCGQILPVKMLRNRGYCFYSPAEIQD